MDRTHERAITRRLLRCFWDPAGRDVEVDAGESARPEIAIPCVLIYAMLIGVKLVILLLLGVPGHSFFYQGF